MATAATCTYDTGEVFHFVSFDEDRFLPVTVPVTKENLSEAKKLWDSSIDNHMVATKRWLRMFVKHTEFMEIAE